MRNISYKGWIDSYRITAGDYSLVVVPEIGGRIMEYSKGGRNIFWQNDNLLGLTFPIAREWHNYGGFQVWPAPQKLWGWPPDPMMDFGKCNVEIMSMLDGTPLLRITGAPSIAIGLLSIREISMNDDGEVSIRTEIRNISGKQITCGAWDVTYVETPSICAFPIKQSSKFTGGIAYFTDQSRKSKQFSIVDGICFVNYMGEEGLIGADSDGPWMVCFNGNRAYIKMIDPMKKGASYPNDCSMQVLTGKAQYGYMEMETFGMLKPLKPGETVSHSEKWLIRDLSSPVTDVKSALKAINGMKGKKWIP